MDLWRAPMRWRVGGYLGREGLPEGAKVIYEKTNEKTNVR
jgi:hypothetical protein